jgi:hypothetical protein
MKSLLQCLAIAMLTAFCVCGARSAETEKIRILLVTGGHGFEHKQFFQLFETNSEIDVHPVEHTNLAIWLKPAAAQNYDVIVLYDMGQDISDETKSDFIARLKDGKGLVVLHHAICSYQKWPEYRRIVGGRYYLDRDVVDRVQKEPSSYLHGQHFEIHVADPAHPVTDGVHDFEIHDETYKGFDCTDDVHPLLTTDEPTSSKVIAWSKTYEKARVVFIQSGHDHNAWDNLNYQRLVRQAIRWTFNAASQSSQ